jgi:hypothetical protein
VNFVIRAPDPLPPFIYTQCDRDPQLSVGWRPRSGHEIERGLGLGPIPLDAHWCQSNTLFSPMMMTSALTCSYRRSSSTAALENEILRLPGDPTLLLLQIRCMSVLLLRHGCLALERHVSGATLSRKRLL